MYLFKRPFYAFLIITLLVAGVGPLASAQAQDEQSTLTLAMPTFLENFFTPETFQLFEEETGITVNLVIGGFPFFPSPANDLDTHLEAIAEYVNSADVLFLMNTSSISIEATRAGYFLDLAPLTGSDATLYPEDFFPAAWQIFQWDQGVWGVPVSLDIISLNYEPEAFDAIGLPYPNTQWTMDDLAYAARALTEYDEEGAIITPGIQTDASSLAWLFRALAGESFYDSSTLPDTPSLTNPALEPLLTTWLELEAEGVNATANSQIKLISGEGAAPLRIETSAGLASTPRNPSTSAGSMLPGDIVGLDAQGFAISAGTESPEAAYALVKYLSSSAEVAGSLAAANLMPARQSVAGMNGDTQQSQGQGQGQGQGRGSARSYTPEVEAFLYESIWYAIPASELRYSGYLSLALAKMHSEGIEAHIALQEAEAEAIANVQAAAAQRDAVEISVATLVPSVALEQGEVELSFGIQTFGAFQATQDRWEQAIAEFVASDPQVAQITFETARNASVDEFAETYDCFYMTQNAVPDLDPQTVLNLDPFIDADPAFDRNDVIGTVMAEIQRDNKTWALPFGIQPSILRYDPDSFAQAGLLPPENGWPADAFTDALYTLKVYPEDPAPFVPSDNTYILMLIAAYGGLPLDYRTDPVTINFTDPANVDAIRQVLDLARDSYIAYSSLSGVSAMFNTGEEDSAAIYTDSANAFGGGFGGGGGGSGGGGGGGGGGSSASEDDEENGIPITYPYGSQYAPAAYSLTTAYISAGAENPEACYRWLSFIVQRPELFAEMPARHSQLTDPALEAAQGTEQVAFYQEYAQFLQSPGTVVFPSFRRNLSNIGNLLVPQWLTRAFDRYVFEDADLEAELAEAQLFATSYQECEASIPPYDPVMYDQPRAYMNEFTQCAVTVDPSFSGLFGGGN